MAATSDTQRAAIRERRRQAQVDLRHRLQRQEALQRTAFSALDRLATQLDMAADLLNSQAGDDPLERAAAITSIAAQLDVDLSAVRRAAGELAAGSAMSKADVATLLGTRQSLLFPRARPPRPAATPPGEAQAS